MRMTWLKTTTVLAMLTVPVAAYAQGTVRGAEEGVREGGRAGGILGVDERPRFREYVYRERQPSYRYEGDVRVGAVLPQRGVRYYEVPREYRVRPGYRYTYVNERPVIVEPRTRRIVEIID
jgi:hypothetical protein